MIHIDQYLSIDSRIIYYHHYVYVLSCCVMMLGYMLYDGAGDLHVVISLSLR